MSTPEPAAAKSTSPALEKFLQRAGSVLARERGINVKSRVLLSALAKELGLGDDELQQGIARLQASAAETPIDPAVAKRRKEYDKYVRGQLKKLPRGILTSSLQLRIVEAGQYSHELSVEDSQTIVRDVVAESGIRVVSRDEAERHVADLIAQQLKDAQWVDDVTTKRLHNVGIEWGLTDEAIDRLIAEHLEKTRHAETVGQRWKFGMIAAGGLVPLALIVVIVWALWRNPESSATPTVAPDGTPIVLPPAPPPPAVADDAWWDKDLTAAIVFLRLNVPARAAALDQLKAVAPADRAAAYEKLAQPIDDELKSPPKLDGLVRVTAGALALDPAPEAWNKLRDSILAQLPAPKDDKLPGDTSLYLRSAWAAETMLAAIAWEGIADERRDALRGALAAALGGSIDGSQPRAQQERKALGLLYERLFRRMQAAAVAEPEKARDAYDALLHAGGGYLDDSVRERLDGEFLVAILPKIGEGWGQFVDLLRRMTQSKESLQVLKLLEIYETTDRPDLQSVLDSFFRSRYELDDVPDDPTKVAAEVRKKLGVRAPVMTADRAGDFVHEAETSLAEAAGGDNPNVWLQQTAKLARANVLGCALVQKELGYGVYDEWREHELPKLETRAPTAVPGYETEPKSAPTGTLESQLRSLRSDASRLARFQPLDRASRLNLLRTAASKIERIDELEPEIAAGVAAYILGGKPDDEQGEVIRIATPLLSRPAIQLAIADGLKTTTMFQELVTQLLSLLLEREVVLGSGEAWRETYRIELIRKVQERLARNLAPAAKVVPAGSIPFDDAADFLREAYAAQAKAQGVPAAQYQAAPSAAALLRLFVEAASSQLAGEKLRPEDADFVRRIPHELAVVDYYSDHPLRQTVLLQRLWARLVGIAATRHQPEKASDVDRLLGDLAKSDAEAENVVVQLRNGEKTILNLWIIAVKGVK